jgi:hypothetical protein
MNVCVGIDLCVCVCVCVVVSGWMDAVFAGVCVRVCVCVCGCVWCIYILWVCASPLTVSISPARLPSSPLPTVCSGVYEPLTAQAGSFDFSGSNFGSFEADAGEQANSESSSLSESESAFEFDSDTVSNTELDVDSLAVATPSRATVNTSDGETVEVENEHDDPDVASGEEQEIAPCFQELADLDTSWIGQAKDLSSLAGATATHQFAWPGDEVSAFSDAPSAAGAPAPASTLGGDPPQSSKLDELGFGGASFSDVAGSTLLSSPTTSTLLDAADSSSISAQLKDLSSKLELPKLDEQPDSW